MPLATLPTLLVEAGFPSLNGAAAGEGGSVLSDTFEAYADGNLDTVSSGAWVVIAGDPEVATYTGSKVAYPATAVFTQARYATSVGTADHWASATIVPVQAEVGVTLRTSTAGTSTYLVLWAYGTIIVWRVTVADGWDYLASVPYPLGELVTTAVLRAEIEDGRITVYWNGVKQLTAVDPDPLPDSDTYTGIAWTRVAEYANIAGFETGRLTTSTTNLLIWDVSEWG